MMSHAKAPWLCRYQIFAACSVFTISQSAVRAVHSVHKEWPFSRSHSIELRFEIEVKALAHTADHSAARHMLQAVLSRVAEEASPETDEKHNTNH